MTGLDATQLDRYARQLVMEEVGPEGQRRLRDGRVLCVGAGGLGAPAIQYLAAAGVGTLGVIDDDRVERSNLQRQVIHADADVGTKKVESAREYVEALNPDVAVETYDDRLGPATADLVAEYDVVVDGSDNLPTRYLVNDACSLAGVPLVHGAVHGFEGQVTTVRPDGPCYRCLFPEAPPAGTVPDCATAGVLGAVPGAVGAMQATEALKLLLDAGETLDGRLLVYDARRMDTETVTYRRDSDCPICGDDPRVDSVREVTYEGACSVR